ncbi:hypothetical protein CAC42_7039 [Sphaceloma murrayae]|uniref:Uncharacterized protein n=1 Tax=Sphaceloma murrayae TaxID=2082308 RepID=A0A2K1QQI2_9PEZI|nr:hypothetical protein CAC42_7039 [Sphaceloma murrayae]
MDFKLRLEKPDHRFALYEGLVMSLAYTLGGLIPMVPYFVIKKTLTALYVSIATTVIVLVAFGYVKAVITGCNSRDRWVSAAQTLAVGVLATGTSYGIVRGINATTPQDKPQTPTEGTFVGPGLEKASML